MDRISEIIAIVSFVLGALKSTPEGRARRAVMRLHKANEKRAKRRAKYEREIRKDWINGLLTKKDYTDLLEDYDNSYKTTKHEVPN